MKASALRNILKNLFGLNLSKCSYRTSSEHGFRASRSGSIIRYSLVGYMSTVAETVVLLNR